jgi:DNA-binding MarR family transcriptional regulator
MTGEARYFRMRLPSRPRRAPLAAARELQEEAPPDSTSSPPSTPTSTIEGQLSPQGEPVIGLYLHVANLAFNSSFVRLVGRGEVTPAIIGVITMLAERPGISQAELARLLRLERATIGTTVARAIAAGFVVRHDARSDARSYALSLTPRGQRMLRTLRRRIAAHETVAASRLTAAERRTLRALLHKLVYG